MPPAGYPAFLQYLQSGRVRKCGMRDGLIESSMTIFDYGCGYGRDVQLLAIRGYSAAGWDPAFFPENPPSSGGRG